MWGWLVGVWCGGGDPGGAHLATLPCAGGVGSGVAHGGALGDGHEEGEAAQARVPIQRWGGDGGGGDHGGCALRMVKEG